MPLTKLGRKSTFIFCQTQQIDTLVRDNAADSALVANVESLGIRVLIAD